MDVVEASEGKPPTYTEIAAALDAEGISLSRPRWAYLLGATGPVVRDVVLLTGLARFFGVPDNYLLEPADSPLPDRVTAQLELVRELNKRKIVQYAARRFDPATVTAADIRALTEALQELSPTEDS